MIERCEWCNGRRIGVTDDLDFDELARLRAENERLRGALDNILARTHDGSSYRMAQDIYQTAIGALVPTAPPAR